MTTLKIGKKYVATEVKTGTSKRGAYQMIKTPGERSGDTDKTIWALFVKPVVEIYDGGTFKITEINSAVQKKYKTASGAWVNNLTHNVSIEVLTKEPPKKPDSFGGFDFSEDSEDEEEETLPY